MSLTGKTVALLEARMSGELSSLVERQGGVAYSVPAVRETAIDSPAGASAFLDTLCAGRFDVIIFMTGVGVSALLKEAEKRNELEAALRGLRASVTVCRGPKPVAVLRRNDVQVNVTAAEPHTTREILDATEHVGLTGKHVGLVDYGERTVPAAEGLRAQGAVVDEVCLYEWRLPDDVAPLERLISEIVEGKVDAIAITSQIQIRHLFQVADRIGARASLADALNRRTVVAAVGPVCASALRSFGVIPHVQPAHPKMGPMVLALADYFDLTAR